MSFSFALKSVAACALAISASTSFAHIVLADPAALANTGYSAALRVGHGCDGAATTAIRVTVPAGFQGAKPQPKAGWVLSTTVGRLAKPYDNHGTPVTEGVTHITWTATPGNALPDAYFDEFVLRGSLPAEAGTMAFKVLQTCEKGSIDWSDMPAPGTSAHDLKTPAAMLEIIPSDHAGHQH
ncbi:YcnI family protein [Rhodoferax sp. WC2427]|uniref:YcnI family copper-binding membrane protein n=1 Tax=Rhodoferax sp. WC2427 TaxID=3234144 RepID=UPI003466AA12